MKHLAYNKRSELEGPFIQPRGANITDNKLRHTATVYLATKYTWKHSC